MAVIQFRSPVQPPLKPLGTPVPTGTFVVTRPFGDLTYPQHGPHDGLDVGNGRVGDPIVAMAPGRVIQAAFVPEAGGAAIVRIDHGQGWSSGYAHMDRIDVKLGQTVQAGDQIGTLGSTGWVDGAHLHFDVTLNGQRVDPWPLLIEDDMRLPDGTQAMAQGVIGPNVGIRSSAVVADDNLIRRTTEDTQVAILFPVNGQGPYKDPDSGVVRTDWVAINNGGELAYVARAYYRPRFVTDAGKAVLPLPVAGGFTQAQVDAARSEGTAIGFSRAKTKAIGAVETIEP